MTTGRPPDRPSAAGPPPGQDAALARLQAHVEILTRKNESLTGALTGAREQLVGLREQVDALATPPSTYGTVVSRHDDDSADVISGGRRLRVRLSPSADPDHLRAGRTVRLNEALAIVQTCGWEDTGEVVTVLEKLTDNRVVVVVRGEDQRVCHISDRLADIPLRQGDPVLFDTRSGFVHEVIPRPEVQDLLLEEVPDITYADIGGLAGQIEAIRDSIELPYLHPELFREHHLRPPKGVLLYGPPGCGKTLIAKAVAASLARQSAQLQGRSDTESYFLNVKGPELLNKYVGETERQIRVVFQRAREHASGGAPVVVFFDEMDSLFRTRGSGLSSDVETTIVPQLLAEIDGVERLDNVIVIGASNREDMIDPAILRPGRLDSKIRIDRPDAAAARDIFSKYLTAQLPMHADEIAAHGDPEATAAALIEATVAHMYARTPANRFLELTYASGATEVLTFGDLASGAMIQNIVDRAKRSAIKDLLATGEKGLQERHLVQACVTEFAENEDLPGTGNPEEWARVSGRRAERVVSMRRVGVQDRNSGAAAGVVPLRDVQDVDTHGQYL